jgi:hypothetical protein
LLTIRLAATLCLCLGMSAVHTSAFAWIYTIKSGNREIYLQVGAGAYSGGDYTSGGTPAIDATVNTVSLSVPPASVGSGAAQAMTSDSAVSQTFYNGAVVCNPPSQVYIGGWSRNGSGAATLTVTTPSSLTNAGGDTVPFSQISWTSGAIGDATADIAAGAFNGGSVALASIAKNTWVEDCMTFTYKNTVTPAAGTYTGVAVYTLSQP